MPVIMMTSVDTLYEVISQDTNPINRLGAPRIESSFNGLTQMALQNPSSHIQQRELAEAAFKQQQKYLSDAAQVAVNIFNPVITAEHRFRSTVKLTAITGSLQAFDLDSESSGLAYTLALALNWGEKKGLFNPRSIPSIPIFATGCVPVDCYVKPIGHLTKKIQYACDYMENNHPQKNANSTRFYILIPAGNLDEFLQNSALQDRVNQLGGELISISHVSEALHLLMGEAFDGGIFTQTHHGFAGLRSISYEQRHLFMGREALVQTLFDNSQTAIAQSCIHTVTGISGSGKSSAVMAGLVPQLLAYTPTSSQEQRLPFNPHWVLVRPNQFTNFDDLLYSLLASFTSDKPTIAHWLSLQAQPELMAATIQEYLEQHADDYTEYERTLWVIDQYEEIFTHTTINPTQAQRLFALLSECAKQLPVLIITVLRTEYLGALGKQASVDTQLPRHIPATEIEKIIQLQLQYHRLNTEAAQAQHTNADYHQHLDHRIKNHAIGKPLTTVSYLLEQMHQQMIAEDASATLLKHAHYDAVGGIDGVISQQAELALQAGLSNIESHAHQATINGFFEALIDIDSEQQATAKTLNNTHIAHYPDGVNQLIQAFMSKGLIIDCGRSDTPKIKLAHDTLLPHTLTTTNPENSDIFWPRLATWFAKHKNFLLCRKNIEPLYWQWLLTENQPTEFIVQQKSSIQSIRQHELVEKTYNPSFKKYLQQSLHAYQRKRFLPWCISAVICLVFAIGIWDQFFRIKSDYVAYVSDYYGVPAGVTSLNMEQKEARQFHYRLDYQAGRLLTLARYNSFGSLKNDVDRNNAARWEYRYAENGDLLQVHSYAQNGKALASQTYEFSPAKNIAQVRFKYHGTQTSLGDIAYQSARFEGKVKDKSEITQHRLIFNEQGLIYQRFFLNNHEQPVKDSSGAYGLQYYYNEQGLITKIEYIDQQGQSVSINGVHSRAITRDTAGNITSKQWLDKNNALIINPQGYALTTTEYDHYGNLTAKHYLENEIEISTHKYGFSRATARYDQFGNQIEQAFLDENGAATLHKWGFARVELKYDNRGNAIEWKYFDENNQPTLRNKQFFRITFAYDEWGNRIAESYFDTDNKPVLHANGYASFTAKYNAAGNRLEEAYYGLNGQPIANKKGYARIRSEYDIHGNQIKRAYYNTDNQLTANQFGYAYYQAEYNRQGNRTRVQFYNANQQLVNNHYLFAQIAMTYDEHGNKTDIRYLDTQGKPTLHKDGVARTLLRYNDFGQLIEAQFFDKTDRPVFKNNRYARVTLQYDARGNRIEERFFGLKNEPILQKKGYSRQSISYDKRNNPIEWQYFDTTNQPINSSNGYARAIAEYDQQDNVIGRAYYDVQNQLISSKGSLKKTN